MCEHGVGQGEQGVNQGWIAVSLSKRVSSFQRISRSIEHRVHHPHSGCGELPPMLISEVQTKIDLLNRAGLSRPFEPAVASAVGL